MAWNENFKTARAPAALLLAQVYPDGVTPFLSLPCRREG